MKLPDKKKVKNLKLKKKPIIKLKKEKILVVAQEFKFARLLSGNEKKTRDRVLRSLKKWLLNCFEKGYDFKEDDFIRVWKGLFYAVWMSDKPLVQEELCDSISEVLDLFPVEQIDYAIMMIKAGFRVLATEWYGLDQHRMDKFLMLVRRYLRGGWRCLSRAAWDQRCCERFADMMTGPAGVLAVKPPSFARNSLSLMLHITDCYLEEISKVSGGSIPGPSLAALLRPFTRLVCSDSALAVPARRLLTALLAQSSLGLDYQDKTRAWQKMGCPAGGPEALELVDDDDEEEQSRHSEEEDDHDSGSGPLDPRAGRVSVFLRPLEVPAALLAAQLRGDASSHVARRRADLCADRFEALSSSRYPLPVRECDQPPPRPAAPSLARAAKGLYRLERRLGESADVLALKDLSRKHRKKLLAKTRAGLSIVEEVAPDSTIGDWQVEETETNEKNSNKENLKKKKNRKRKTTNGETALDNKKPKISENGIKTETKIHTNKVDKKPINNEFKKEKRTKIKSVSDTENDNKNTGIKTNKVDKLRNGTVDKNKKKNKVVSEQSDKSVKNKNEEIKIQNVILKPPKLIITKSPINNEFKKEKQTKIKSVSDTENDNKNTGIKTNKVDKLRNGTVDKNKKKNKVFSEQSDKSAKNKNEEIKIQNVILKPPKLIVTKSNQFQKRTTQVKNDSPKKRITLDTPKKVKFVLENNSMQNPVDYYKSVRQSPSIPYDRNKQPSKTNLKVSTPSPINPFFEKKFKL